MQARGSINPSWETGWGFSFKALVAYNGVPTSGNWLSRASILGDEPRSDATTQGQTLNAPIPFPNSGVHSSVLARPSIALRHGSNDENCGFLACLSVSHGEPIK